MRATRAMSAGTVGIIALAAALGADAPPPANQNAPNQAAQPLVHLVAPGDLLLTFRRDGRIDSAQHVKIRLTPEAYRGPFEVVEILKRSGPVSKGEHLLRFDTADLEEDIEKARETLHDAKRRLQLARDDCRIALEAASIRLERAERAKTVADHELEIWNKYNADRMIKTSALGVQARENNLDDQKEELAQLEAMYQGTRLDSATKEIVLQRARRNVKMSGQWLRISQNDNLITTQYRHGDRDRQIREDALHRALELEHTRANNIIAKARKEMEIEAAERKLRDAEKRLADLQADMKCTLLTAPAGGFMTPIDLQPGDTVNARQVVAEVLDPHDLVVNLSAKPEDLRILAEDATVSLTFPDFPEIDLAGSLRQLSPIGSKSGDSTNFDAVVGLQGTHPLLRIGLRCSAQCTTTIPDVLLIPRKAVTDDHGTFTCNLWAEGRAVTRTIRVGAANDDMYQVVSGLEPGDEILLSEPSKTTAREPHDDDQPSPQAGD